jgi:5-methylcytosine-specific restriction endonuclease McrA
MKTVEYSENMLRQFAILCGGSYQEAILLNHLYYEAYEHAGRDGNYTMNLAEVSKELRFSEDHLSYYVIDLEEGLGLIENNWDECEVTSCVPNLRVIDFRLSQISVEEEKVKKHNKRAIELNNLGTLTVVQWMSLLNHFGWRCAYCVYYPAADGAYEVLEHIIPLTFPSGGTTRWNCVPACKECNSLKGPYHPDRLPRNIKSNIGERLDRVRESLNRWKAHTNEMDLKV